MYIDNSSNDILECQIIRETFESTRRRNLNYKLYIESSDI